MSIMSCVWAITGFGIWFFREGPNVQMEVLGCFIMGELNLVGYRVLKELAEQRKLLENLNRPIISPPLRRVH